MFRLGMLIVSIMRSDSQQVGKVDGQDWKADSLLSTLVQELEAKEGPAGTRWKLLKSFLALQTFQTTQKPADLEFGGKLLSQILVLRPRWSDALALSGDYASVQGKAEQAVDFYRRAIAEGDNRVDTTFSLVRQLNLLGKYEQAEAEFQRIAGLSDRVGAISEIAVGIAQRKGNFDEALEMARRATEQRRNDASAWIVRAQSALAKSTSMRGDATELILRQSVHYLKQIALPKERI